MCEDAQSHTVEHLEFLILGETTAFSEDVSTKDVLEELSHDRIHVGLAHACQVFVQ